MESYTVQSHDMLSIAFKYSQKTPLTLYVLNFSEGT